MRWNGPCRIAPGNELCKRANRLQSADRQKSGDSTSARERMLYRLIFADRPIEDGSLFCIVRCPAQCGTAHSNAFHGNEYALRIQAVKEIMKSLSLFSDQILLWDGHAVEKYLIGIDGLSTHFRYLSHVGIVSIKIGVKQADSIDRPFRLFDRGRANQQHDLVGDLR